MGPFQVPSLLVFVPLLRRRYIYDVSQVARICLDTLVLPVPHGLRCTRGWRRCRTCQEAEAIPSEAF